MKRRTGPARTASSTPLARWMDSAACKLTAQQIADALGVALVTVYNLRRGVYKPSRRVAVELERLSGGAVKACAWDAKRKRGAA